MRDQLITIDTTRYSQFFRRVLAKYTQDVIAEIDGRKYHPAEFPSLSNTWATNASISRTRDFVLKQGTKELFGFHDHPSQMWGALSELPFLQELAEERIIRIKVPHS
jgi:hypothetical protein